jgi:MSHA biogenesis protein MshL
VNNAPVRQVLLSMVEGTPYSVVLHPELAGTVSLNLKSVTVPEAMLALRHVYGYDFRRDGNRFYMHGRGIQTRMFPVNYLNFDRKGRSDTRIVTGELTQIGSTSSGGSGTTGTTTPQPGQTTTRSQAGVRVETESKIDFWRDLQDTLAVLVGCDLKAGVAADQPRTVECRGGRMVAVNAQASLVVVRAMPDELRLVEDYLGVTQDTVNRQVILEAKIIEVELNDGYQTGINWAALGERSTIGQVGGGTIFDGSGRSETAGQTGDLNPGAGFTAIDGALASAFGGVFSVAIKTNDFAAFLELLKTQGNVHVLSSPRVSTVNNQKAVIKVGGDNFFVTGVTGGTPASVGVPATAPTVTLTPFFSGIALDVTPQIDDAKNIILHIHPAISDVTQRDKAFVVGDQDFSLPLAASTIQESDNVVRAGDGQVIVIGGLMKEGSTDQDAGVPLLADIPILGNAFKHKRVTRIKKELIILLKPTIVDHSQVWESALRDSQGRIEKLKR